MPLGHSGVVSPYINGAGSNAAEVNSGRLSHFGIVVPGYHCSHMQNTIPGLVFSKLVKHENGLGCTYSLALPHSD